MFIWNFNFQISPQSINSHTADDITILVKKLETIKRAHVTFSLCKSLSLREPQFELGAI